MQFSFPPPQPVAGYLTRVAGNGAVLVRSSISNQHRATLSSGYGIPLDGPLGRCPIKTAQKRQRGTFPRVADIRKGAGDRFVQCIGHRQVGVRSFWQYCQLEA
jgi:hypothetical protein